MRLVTSISVRDATQSRVIDGKLHPVEVTMQMRIAVARFAENGDLHTLRRALPPLSMKIISLPKFATQSPRLASIAPSRALQRMSSR